MSECVTIITEQTGKRFVLINDLRFKGKTKEEWKEIEGYLKEYIGKYYEISETAEKIYIGKDFPDEFAHGKDKTVLKGPNLKAKANAGYKFLYWYDKNSKTKFYHNKSCQKYTKNGIVLPYQLTNRLENQGTHPSRRRDKLKRVGG